MGISAHSRSSAFRTGAAGFALSMAMLMPTVAQAQATPADSKTAASDEEIVVTGTNIRGVPPVGSNAISIGAAKLQEVAAQSSNELLASIPQVTNYFNRVPVSDLGIAVNQIQISRPNIRNLSGNNSSSSATLILVDGHRIATAGVNQASVDPDLIPTGAIARVEVQTEGGSATYGADAVAGVINFITHKRFDGIKVDGHYGFAKNYWQYDGSITAGKTWDNGSAWVSYSYTKNDALYGRERSYVHNLDYSKTPYVGLDLGCEKSNLTLGTTIIGDTVLRNVTTYGAPSFVAGTANRCENILNSTLVPRAERHGVVGGLSWDFSSDTSIDVRAYWGQRKTHASSDFAGSVPVGPLNPAAASLPTGLVVGPTTLFGFPAVTTASVAFNLRPLLGDSAARSDTVIREYGANAELKQNIGDNWQVRALANWSESDSSYELTRLNQTRLNAAGAGSTATTAFNPLDVTKNNAALVADLIDNEIAGQAKDSLLNFRVIADGKLFELPGGFVRMAVGAEYVHDKLQQRFQSDIRVGALGTFAFTPYTRNVTSAFGEIIVPLISNGEGGSMLTISAAGRYDHYSDFGNTFNPKIGATFKPTNWISFRGNYGTSFTAPTPLDQLGALRNSTSYFGFAPFQRASDQPLLAGLNGTIALQGSNPGLKPQKAKTYSFGVDLDPLEGLQASINYYDVKFTDILGTPTPNAGIFTDFPNNIIADKNGLTSTQILAFIGNTPSNQALVTSSLAAGRVYEVVDFRVGNFGIVHVKGIDFGLNFRHPTSFGSFDAAMNWTATLSRTQQPSPTSAVVDQTANGFSKLSLQMIGGVNIGDFRAQATWNHSAGYAITPTNSVPVQSYVEAFNTVNLFFKYDLPGEGVMKDLSLTLNVNNVFDTNPPVLLRNNPNEFGFANGFTLGRMFIVGFSKKF